MSTYVYEFLVDQSDVVLRLMNQMGSEGWKAVSVSFEGHNVVRACMERKYERLRDPTRGGGPP